jgi:hypothetical protein
MKMTAADWMEMAQSADSNTIACFGILITLMSGYLVVAYLVGEKLTRTQVSIVNSLYVISALSVISGHSQYTRESLLAGHQAHFSSPDSFAAVDPAYLALVPVVLAVINISLIVSSLYFMWSVRHPRSE